MSFVTETPFSVTEASSGAPPQLCSKCDHAAGVRRASGFVLVGKGRSIAAPLQRFEPKVHKTGRLITIKARIVTSEKLTLQSVRLKIRYPQGLSFVRLPGTHASRSLLVPRSCES